MFLLPNNTKSDCDILHSEYIKITTNGSRRCGISEGGAEFKGRTNLTRKSRKFLARNRRVITSREKGQDLKANKILMTKIRSR